MTALFLGYALQRIRAVSLKGVCAIIPGRPTSPGAHLELFDPRPMYRSFMGLLEDDPTTAPKRRRNLRALVRKTATEAQSK